MPDQLVPGGEKILGTGDGRGDFFDLDVLAGEGRVFKLVATPT
ncbi:MAG: hypothetical protein ACRDSR_21490 [Pseudonocardiaceae bacterium]